MQEKKVPGYPTVIEKRVRSKNRGGDDGDQRFHHRGLRRDRTQRPRVTTSVRFVRFV